MRYRRILQPGATYFLTMVTFGRRPVLADTRVIGHLRAAVSKVQQRSPFIVDAEVILPDHIHVLWTLPDDDADYSTRVRLMKSYFTRSAGNLDAMCGISPSREAKGERAVWQRRFWEHTIHDEKDFLDHLDYIHFNPVKHGLVKAARDWPHSTFQDWVERGVYEPWWGSDDAPPLPQWVGRE
jgi:putative transposase